MARLMTEQYIEYILHKTGVQIVSNLIVVGEFEYLLSRIMGVVMKDLLRAMIR